MALTKVTYGLISADTSAIDLNIDQNTLYVETSGNRVGIGTTSPGFKLQINGTDNSLMQLKNTNGSSGQVRLQFNRDSATRWNIGANVTNDFTFYDQQNTTTPFKIESGAGDNTLVVDSNSRVGIGTNSPSEKLHISSASPVIRLEDTTDPQTSGGSIGKIEFYGNDGSSGGAGVRSYLQTVSTNAAGNDHALAIGLSGSNAAPTEKIRLTNTGLGIGRTSPVSKLDVYNSSGTTPAFTTFNAGNSSDITSFAAHAALQLICYQSEGNPYTKTSAIIANADGTVPSEMQFWTKTNGASSVAERMRIDGSGNVLIGETSAITNNKLVAKLADSGVTATSNQSVAFLENNTNAWLTIGSGTSSYGGILFADSGDSDIGQVRYNHNGNEMEFITNTAVAMTIDSSGNVGIGISSVQTQGALTGNLLEIHEPSFGSGVGGTLVLSSDNTANGRHGGRIIGRARSYVYSSIDFQADSAMANGGLLKFSTLTAGSATTDNPTERMRIDSSGNVGIGMTPIYRLDVTNNSTGVQGRFSSSSTSGTSLSLQNSATNGRNYRIGSNFVTGTGEFSIYDDTASAERMRIDSSGDVLVGTTNGTTVGTVNKHLVVGSTTNNDEVAVTLNVMEGTNNRRAKFFLDDDNGVYGLDTTASTGVASFVVRTAGTERMRIGSNGKIGVATTSTDHQLTVNASAFDGIQLQSGGSDCGYLGVNTDTVYVGAGSNLIFHTGNAGLTNGSERMRIDSSGRFIVGSTSAFDSSSFCVDQSGLGQFRRDGTPLIIRRDGSQGGLIDFEKDGASIGSISSQFSDLAIYSTASGHHGIRMHSVGILPTDNTGALEDNTTDLGSTTYHFKDLHLSGGAYLGGTGSANKLDDYEEGTYDATISCASGSITLYTSYTALRYTKIGRQVHIHGKLAVNSVSSPTGATNLNLPFVISNDTDRSGQADNIMTGYFNGSAVTNGIYPIYGYMAEAASVCRLFIMVIPATHNLGDNYTAQGTDYHINFTYTTD